MASSACLFNFWARVVDVWRVDDSGSASDSDVTIPGGDTISSLPSLQGRFLSLSDYLPETPMPDISFSNPANFWYS